MGQTIFSRNRLEALSDGVFAIVMTLARIRSDGARRRRCRRIGSGPLPRWAPRGSFAIKFLCRLGLLALQQSVFEVFSRVSPLTVVPTLGLSKVRLQSV